MASARHRRGQRDCGGRPASLFTLFEQVDGSTTRSFEGAGLGLAVCKRLVEGMGGSLGAESEPGKGSSFWVLLPLPKVT